MSQPVKYKIALIGNPNSGKSSVFNQLTGLRQKVGNFPGITVEKKTGTAMLSHTVEAFFIDFPGTYSLYPTSHDERIVVNTLTHPTDENYPDLVLYVADLTNLERQLLLLTQVQDLGIPVVLALNMKDVADREGIKYHPGLLASRLHMPAVAVSGRTGENMEELKSTLLSQIGTLQQFKAPEPFYGFSEVEKSVAQKVQQALHLSSPYLAKLIAHHHARLPHLSDAARLKVETICRKAEFKDLQQQMRETMQRYDKFLPIVQQVLKKPATKGNGLTDRIDNILVHRVWGPVLFFLLMVLVFQAIFSWSSYPMDWIEAIFGWLGQHAKNFLGHSGLANLLTDGILAGLGGIVVFIPQIAVLFFLISLLEEVGYMARAVFMFDRIMQKFGLNGRSIVALISGGACAIPAIMSTRTIGNWRERLITIMVTPLVSCSARIPVYTVLIGFAVPSVSVWGVFNLQGLAFFGLYLLGIGAALFSAVVFKKILKSGEGSYLMIELPPYRLPVMKNVWLHVLEKVRTFLTEAGKIILVISVVLWFLASYGPGNAMQVAEQEAREQAAAQGLDQVQTADLIAARQIEKSYAGHIGKLLEPAIQPLGFDWKIGIALLTSFAAREVFVGTMATIYSIGSADDDLRVRDRMAIEKNPDTGQPVYGLATSLSLLIFYVFAMQCMSTLAVVRKETQSWKWPLIQFAYMSVLAYLGSFLVYQLLA